MNNEVISLEGTIFFDSWEQKKAIKKGILRRINNVEELIIEFDEPGCGTYTAQLKYSYDNVYTGSYLFDGNKNTGKASCQLYSYKDKIALIGDWLEDGSDCYWNAELQFVSKKQI
jgi:hypothetical protein